MRGQRTGRFPAPGANRRPETGDRCVSHQDDVERNARKGRKENRLSIGRYGPVVSLPRDLFVRPIPNLMDLQLPTGRSVAVLP